MNPIRYDLSHWEQEQFFITFFCSWTLIPCSINIHGLTRYVFNLLKTVTPYPPPHVPILDFVMLKLLTGLQWGKGTKKYRERKILHASPDFRLRSQDTRYKKGVGASPQSVLNHLERISLILYMLCVLREALLRFSPVVHLSVLGK